MKRVTIFVLLALMVGCSRDPKVQRDKYFASGQNYLDTKKYEEASIEFRNALRLDKDHVRSYLGIAKAFQGMGNHQDAIGAFQQVIKLDGKNVEARLRLGDYMIAGGISNPGIFKQAQQMAEEALKVEPSNKDALLLLGNSYAGQNEIDRSIEQFQKVLSMDPGNLKAMLNLAAGQFRKKDAAAAEATFKEALQKHPNEIQAHLTIATFYAATNRTQETENHLKIAFDLAPSDSRSLYSLSSFYLASKKPAEAENVFKQAITRKPKEREPRWGLANFYLQQGKPDLANEALNEILRISKGDRPALLRLAEIYLNRNDEAKAEENIKTVLTANKNDAQAHYLQGKIFRRRQQLDKAMTEFEDAVKQDASLAPAYLEKANLQLIRGDFDACETTLRAILQRNKGFLPAQAAYAKLLALRQKPQDALQLAEEVLVAMPNNEDAIGARADALRLSGKLEESKKNWVRLCEMQPQNSGYWHRLATVEAMQGDNASALAHLRKALELKPDLAVAINDTLYLHLKAKNFDAALAELDRLAKSSSPQDEIHRFRGQVFSAKGDTASAESEFRKAIEINPKNYQAYILLGQLNMQRNNIPQAIKEVDQLIAQNNKLPAVFLLKGYYLQIGKDIPGAIASYRKTLELDSENPVAANNLAWLLCESNGNLEEALTLAKAARKKASEDPDIADTLGWIYYKMKNHTLAVDQLLFSVNNRKQPKAEHYYRLGMAYYAKGDLILAKQTLRKSLEMDSKIPGADDARKIIKQL
jgi:tetratricopeptide (TPR) repeat protein